MVLDYIWFVFSTIIIAVVAFSGINISVAVIDAVVR